MNTHNINLKFGDWLKEKNNLIIFGILSLALFLRLLGLDKGMWQDEYGTIMMITKGNLYKVIMALRTDTHPPLYFVLLKLWSYVSIEEWWLRLLSVVFGMGTIVFTMKWLRSYSVTASYLAGASLAVLPEILQFSQELRPYPLLIFLVSLLFYFASKIVLEPNNKTWYYALSSTFGITIFTHFTGIMFIIPVYTYILLASKDKSKICYEKLLVSLLIPFFAFILMSFWHLDVMASKFANWHYPKPDLIRVLFIFMNVSGVLSIMEFFRFTQNKIFIDPFYLDVLFIFVAGIIAALVLRFGKWKLSFPMLVAALMFWAQMIVFSWLFVSIVVSTTVLAGAIPMIGFVSVMMATMRFGRIQKFAITLFIIMILLFASDWAVYRVWRPVENIRGVARLAETNLDKETFIILYPHREEYKECLKIVLNSVPTKNIKTIPSNASSWRVEDAQKTIKEITFNIDSKYPSKLMIILFSPMLRDDDYNLYCGLIRKIKETFTLPVEIHIFLIKKGEVSLSKRVSKYYNKFIDFLRSEISLPLVFEEHPGFVYAKYRI